MIFINNWAKKSKRILLFLLWKIEKVHSLFLVKKLCQRQRICILSGQTNLNALFFLIPIQRGPITLLKRIAHMAKEYTKQENKKKILRIGKQTLINPPNTSRTATAKSNTTTIKRRRAPMLMPSHE